MAGLIALVGGDEFRPGCESMDEQILAATGVSSPKVLLVPTAAAQSNPQMAAANGVNYFNGLGGNAEPLMVLNSEDADNTALVSSVDDADMIYLSGGNPSYLLDALTDSVLLEKIRKALDRGAIVAGSSAGAMVMGTWMRFREWRQALGLSGDVVTLPHHERADPKTVSEELSGAMPEGITGLGVDAMSGCIGTPGEWRVVGDGNVTVYTQGGWTRYSNGDVISIG